SVAQSQAWLGRPARAPSLSGWPPPNSGQRPKPLKTPEPHRILFVDHTASLGGGEIAMLNLVRHFDATRYHPIVVLFSDGPLVAQLKNAGIETQILPIGDAVLHARKDAIG